MAAKFNQPLITNVGREMLIDVGASQGTITYTNAIMFDQSVNNLDEQQIQAVTELNGQKMSVPIGEVSRNGNSVTLSASFSNKGVTKDITFNTVGWFAKTNTTGSDGKEHLLAISPASTQGYLAAQSPDGNSTQSIDLHLYMAISNDANITIQANEDGVVYQDDLKAALQNQSNIFDAKLANAGQVKKINFDGKDYTPDGNGVITMNSKDDDLTGFASKEDLAKLRNDITTGSIGNYSKATLDQMLLAKANASDVYTKPQTDAKIQSVLSDNKYVNNINGQQADDTGKITVTGTKVSQWDFSGPDTVQTTAGADITSLDAMTADDLRKIISKFMGVENEIQEIKDTALFGKVFKDEDSAMAWNAKHPNDVCIIQN